jgi:hypothetical protein
MVSMRRTGHWVSTAMLVSAAAQATPRSLPMTYPATTTPKDNLEIELYTDLAATRAHDVAEDKDVFYLAPQFQLELEYGISDRFEVAFYAMFAPSPAAGLQGPEEPFQGNGAKQRIRYALADPGEWPIDLTLYAELVESQNEFEIEAKVIVQRRFGHALIIANVSSEVEFPWNGGAEFVVNPSLGLTYEFAAWFHLGLESWMRVAFPLPAEDPKPFNDGPHFYVGPAAMLNWGRLWASLGIYARLNSIDRPAVPGELYGPIWVRSIVGVNL